MKKKFNIDDRVSWNSEAGRVSGMIVRRAPERFRGQEPYHHAGVEVPQYEIKSNKTEHITFHNGSALARLRD